MYSDEEILNYMEQKLREGGTKVSVTFDALGFQVLKSTDDTARRSVRRAVADAMESDGIMKEETRLNSYMAFYIDDWNKVQTLEIVAFSIEDAEHRMKGVYGKNVISIKPLP